MSYTRPNSLQVAMLYDQPGSLALDNLISNFLKSEANEFGYHYHVSETDGQTHARCFGGQNNDVMVFVELVSHPTDKELFSQALGCIFNQMTTPDAEALIDRHKGYLLINVHHGPIPDIPQYQELLTTLQMPRPGNSSAQFLERLRVLGLIAALATDISKPTISHWTYSNILVKTSPDMRSLMLEPGPSPLHILPMPFRGEGREQEQEQGIVGLETFGAANFIGREIRVRPSAVEWPTVYMHVLGYINLACQRNGYIVPDGDTFGDEERTFSYRVHYTAAPLALSDGPVDCYEFEPLLNKEQNFQSPTYIPPDRAVDIDQLKDELGHLGYRERGQIIKELREKNEKAEAVGVRLEWRLTGTDEARKRMTDDARKRLKDEAGMMDKNKKEETGLVGWILRKLGR